MVRLSLKLFLVLSVILSTVTHTYCAEDQSDDEVDITTSVSSTPELTNKEKNSQDSGDTGKDADTNAEETDDKKGVVEESDKTGKPESNSGDASGVTTNTESVTDSVVEDVTKDASVVTINTESVTESVAEDVTKDSEQTKKDEEVVTVLGATEVVTGEPITEVVTEIVTGFITEIQTELVTITTEVITDVIDLEHGFDVKAANLVMDAYIDGMKKDVNADKLYLVGFTPYIRSRWGSVQLHGGRVSGLSNAYRVGDILLKTSDFGHIKSFSGDVVIPNVIAKFKADIKLFNRLNVRNRVLTITIDKLLAHLDLDLDVDKKKLIIKSVEVKYLEGFKGKSGRLIWPLNKLADSILRNEQENIIKAIKLEVSKHMQKVVTDVNVENAITKLLTKH